MTDLEKLRKQTRKNWKKEMKAKYKRIMYKANLTIQFATENYCMVEIRPGSHFATWLVAKKLEAKGFKCEIKEAILFSRYRPNDELYIEWGK